LDSLNEDLEEPYDLYKDGLRIYTTLDYGLQQYAENAVHNHMKKLQTQFETSYGKNAPWIKNDKLIMDHVKSLPDYKILTDKGLNEQQILDSMKVTYSTPVFSYEGDTILPLSTIDSLKYYLKFLNTGFVAIDPHSGAIKSYVGGINFEHFKYDHVSTGKRQVGSTFKPIVYAAAIENGIEPCSYFSLESVSYEEYDGWTPTNASNEETDPYMNYSMANALTHSINTISVKVLDAVGIEAVVEQAKKMGVESTLPKVPSLALGTAELSLIELATAYTSFVNNGKHTNPYFIERIEDKNGDIIYQHEKSKLEQVAFSENTRGAMLEMMKSVVNEGTAQRLRSVYGLPNDLAGKTGTTQNNKDGWFVGVTPNLIIASWVGNDDHRIGFRTTSMGQGANTALPIVAEFIKQYNSDVTYKSISQARFPEPNEDVIAMLDCDPEKRDGFFKRLFSSKEKDDKTEVGKKKKKGFFSFLKRKKSDDN
ncbi:penicillin-binding transpeptidase domain-containing protein, partial [Aegicerativicinus sediminis]